MGFGLGVLRLAPDAFWRMTPREIAAAASGLHGGGGGRSGALKRADFERLMARFPDRETDDG
ncbi:rcc01693 family protein [Hansschlegelia plantiphila]|uniref:Phage tail assembly chaperone n=1 Tax=Hansschlegelia plantiphila TaxID=374655 RepID=A0A9W6J1B9_9HYPH|nr:rcc01693 family protein [Hansschlegelia plantiphila]GLK67908.1 hypothetical protein GCM10008179_15460 [Hansschlegelia plantiphila]